MPVLVMVDSLAMTAAGNVCVALPTNIAFGGPEMMAAWLIFFGARTLVKTRWDEPGTRLPFNA